MKALVLLSGGCESSALLEYGKREGHELHAVHVSFSNATLQENDFCKELCDYYNIPLYFPSIDNSLMNRDHGKYNPYDISRWLPIAALIASTNQDYDEVWYGAHKKDNLPVLGRIEVIFDLLIGLTKQPPNTKIKAPLYPYTKLDQYKLVPKELRNKIVYCWENKTNPCGKCKKCVEWKEQGLTR